MLDLNENLKQLFYGYSCELLTAHYYLSKFCHVYLPFAPHSRVDLIVEGRYGGLTRVQIKKAKYVECGNYGHKYLQCNTNYVQETESCDYDFLVVIHNNKLWEIPAYEIKNTKIVLANDNVNSKKSYPYDIYQKEIKLELS